MSPFLTPDELAEWTGYRRRGKVIEQLRRWHVQFRVPADGWPRVPRSARIEQPPEPIRTVDNADVPLELDGPASILWGHCVYFAQVRWRDGTLGPIKIGYTKNLPVRMTALWRTLYDRRAPRLLVLLTLPGGKDLEAEYHRRFDHLRIEGEWFEAGDDLLDFTGTMP